MQEDKKLKELLIKYAVEETPEDFTGNVMQRIKLITAKKYTTASIKYSLLKILIIVFLLVSAVLFMVSIFIKNMQLPFYLSIKFPAEYFSQIIFFLIAFWFVMLINLFWNKLYSKNNYF